MRCSGVVNISNLPLWHKNRELLSLHILFYLYARYIFAIYGRKIINVHLRIILFHLITSVHECLSTHSMLEDYEIPSPEFS